MGGLYLLSSYPDGNLTLKVTSAQGDEMSVTTISQQSNSIVIISCVVCSN